MGIASFRPRHKQHAAARAEAARQQREYFARIEGGHPAEEREPAPDPAAPAQASPESPDAPAGHDEGIRAEHITAGTRGPTGGAQDIRHQRARGRVTPP